jgi:ABC-type transport system involved in multi-copper enzyme maturation permease subunit
MNPLSEVGLLVSRELRKSIRSVKGILMLVISLLGAAGMAMILNYLRKLDEAKLSPEQIRELQEAALTKKYGSEEMGHYLADAPSALLIMLMASVWLTPLLIAVLGFDSVAADIQYRSVRFWTVRSRRWTYFTGKFLGQWIVASIAVLALHLITWIIAIGFGGVEGGKVLSWGLRFYFVTVPITGAWCGISSLVSSQFRTPILGLLATCATFFALWLLDVVALVSERVDFFKYVYPNTYDEWLLSPNLKMVAGGTAICLAFAALSVGSGSFIFAKRDV